MRQLGISSRQRLALTLAAILLVLHWAAPSILPPDVPAPSRNSGPVFSSGFVAAQRGTLPRALPRAHVLEAGLSKTSRGAWHAGSKLVAPPQAIHIAWSSEATAVLFDVSGSPRSSRSAHDFEARAPPSPTA